MTPLDVPEWKCDSISMDFVTSLPNTPKGNDDIWVVVDRLTKSAHFIPINITFPVAQLAEIYIRDIVKLHGVPSSIESGENVVLGPEIVQQTTEKVRMIQEKMKA